MAEQPLLEARLSVPGPMLTLAGETGLQRLRRTYGRQDADAHAGADAAADSG